MRGSIILKNIIKHTNMITTLTISALLFFSLILITSPIDGRKGPGEYWTQVMEGQPMPESIKIFVHNPLKNVANDYEVKNLEEIKVKSQDKNSKFDNTRMIKGESFVKNFDPIPNLSVYHEDATDHQIDSTSKKSFTEGSKPKPSLTSYRDDTKSTVSELFIKNFDPVPNLSVYHDDAIDHEIDSMLNKSFVEGSKPRPSITSHRDDTKSTKGESKFVRDFDPIPNLSVYHDDATDRQIDSTLKKSFVEGLKPLSQ
ncbi:hypothetical protein RND81_09G046700 [Saponaria officinalis]|uniref:Organ specific protein n=2 Tax=Saponaria officinalis TaxID=3572 RepID=A0AAW1IIS0_SAPOF